MIRSRGTKTACASVVLVVVSACASGGSAIAAADIPHMLAASGIDFHDIKEPYPMDDGHHIVGIESSPNCTFTVRWDGFNFVMVAVSIDGKPFEMIQPEAVAENDASAQLGSRCEELQES